MAVIGFAGFRVYGTCGSSRVVGFAVLWVCGAYRV